MLCPIIGCRSVAESMPWKSMLAASQSATELALQLMHSAPDNCREKATETAYIMCQHLAVQVIDKADPRQASIEACAIIMSLTVCRR